MADTPALWTTGAQRYDIRVLGHLAHRWTASFTGMVLLPQDDGSTIIRGVVTDQSALHGLLCQVGDLGLALVSLTATTDPSAATATKTLAPADRPAAGPTSSRSTT